MVGMVRTQPGPTTRWKSIGGRRGIACLKELARPGVFEKLEKVSSAIADGRNLSQRQGGGGAGSAQPSGKHVDRILYRSAGTRLRLSEEVRHLEVRAIFPRDVRSRSLLTPLSVRGRIRLTGLRAYGSYSTSEAAQVAFEIVRAGS